MKEKRGQGLSTSTIILLILGIVILVVLILGFTIGWNKIFPFISQNNVDNIKTGCSTACSTDNAYDYCATNRTLKVPDLTAGAQAYGNCTWFSTQQPYLKYGIGSCPTIDCGPIEAQVAAGQTTQ